MENWLLSFQFYYFSSMYLATDSRDFLLEHKTIILLHITGTERVQEQRYEGLFKFILEAERTVGCKSGL